MTGEYHVYILTNAHNTVLYTGVTGDLAQRVAQHRSGCGSRFTSRYNATKLVYAEAFTRIEDAIAREKQIKAGTRARKIALLSSLNPSGDDLDTDSVSQ